MDVVLHRTCGAVCGRVLLVPLAALLGLVCVACESPATQGESASDLQAERVRSTGAEGLGGNVLAASGRDARQDMNIPVSAKAQEQTINPVDATVGDRKLTAQQLRSRIRSFADQYRNEISEACDSIIENRDDPMQRRRAHQYKLNGVTAMYDIAAEPDPQQALLDMLVLVTLQWYVAESHARDQFPKDHPLIRESSRIVKDSGWTLASQVMKEEQRRVLLAVIDRWWQDHGEESEIWYVRITDFVGYGKGTQLEGAVGAVTGLPGKVLNAFVPLGDATQTLDEVSAVAERAAWLAPRMLILAQWRAEALVYQSLATTQVEDVIASTDRAVEIAERATKVAETLPEDIASTSEEVLGQISENEESLTRLLEQARATVDSVSGVAETSKTIVNESEDTVRAADDLVRSVDRLLASWQEMRQQNGGGGAEDEDEPFRIEPYTEAIRSANSTLEETTRVLTTFQDVTEPGALDARLAQINQASGNLADSIIGRLERLVIVTGATVGVVAVVIILVARLVPSRRHVRHEHEGRPVTA